MSDFFSNYSAYILCFLLLTVGLYGMLLKRNYVKKVIGMTIFQAAIILFFIQTAYKTGGTVPVKDEALPLDQADAYINPLPHALMLTAIVVGVATVGVALSLLIRVYGAYGSLDEDDIRREASK
ncbi:cation:proton antiporter subunit C [Pelagicoccus sp. NFK12]|uniref:Cation:proton antiporter subunit C n=1 Tax=Pelagicoccus enzymogenes TaxID=2773457 RepID=A0A927FA28_9BACT|nr:cation:proton antiporter subunit C [Pelagicoccus enzymogenes]MBD5780619.1 cation:proton antiporter subunit C [Pelagicoccus enzymogenes]MDQ8198980.1 cation:proton antiporter subunit C [Pelagicoccus enzymogenes]